MRSRATRAWWRARSSTEMRLTTLPSPRFSSTQRRCCAVMRNIVVPTQTLGSSEMPLWSCSSLLRREAVVHGAIALPEDDARAANRSRRVSAKFLVGIPDDHLFEGDAHAIAGVAAEVLVGEEKHFFACLEGPVHDASGVGTGANRAAMLAGKGFDGRGRVHICDRDDRARIEERRELAPAGLHLADVGHVGHGASSVQVGKNDGLMPAAKNVRALGHKGHAAEDDVAALSLRSLEGEFEGITAEIGELDDFVALVVMAHNHYVPAQAGLRGSNPGIKRVVRQQ